MRDKALKFLMCVITAMLLIQFNMLNSIKKQSADNGVAINDNQKQIIANGIEITKNRDAIITKTQKRYTSDDGDKDRANFQGQIDSIKKDISDQSK